MSAAGAHRPGGEAEDPTAARSPYRALLIEWGSLLLAIILLTATLRLFVAQAFYIPSGSMLPQLQINDRIVVSKISYRLHDPRRGDIVVFDAPASMVKAEGGGSLPARVARGLLEGVNVIKPAKTEFVKRVIALPGEKIEANNGNVYVNGSLLVEPYLPPGVRTVNLEPTIVPPGTVFVMGDNRGGSSDSRVFGPIPQDTIVGRVLMKVWPLGNASWL